MVITLVATALATVFCTLWGGYLFQSLVRRGSWWIGQRTETELAQLFVFVSAGRLLAGTAIAVAAVAILGAWIHAPWPILASSCVALAVAPRLIVAIMRRRRRRHLSAQLPDTVGLWAGLLRSGQSMTAALSQVASRQPEPLGAELRLVLAEYRLGVPLHTAMQALRDRVGVADLRSLATLLHVHRELGGNLAEAMDRLARTLRSRLAMETRIQSLTAQGRLQGVVVGALPLLLAAVLAVMEPTAMHAMVSTPAGWAALAVIVALEFAGFVLIRRIVNIDV